MVKTSTSDGSHPSKIHEIIDLTIKSLQTIFSHIKFHQNLSNPII